MGQGISTAINPPPLTLQHCLIDGVLDVGRYTYYRRRCDDVNGIIEKHHRSVLKKRKRRMIQPSNRKKRKAIRSCKSHGIYVRDHDGSLREIRPTDTLWYLLYVAQAPANKRLHQLFRTRFRMPYDSFISLSHELTSHSSFTRWTRCDAVGKQPSNIKLLLLGCMRYIGRAWTLDDVSEANGISIYTNRDFILSFIEYGSTVLYKKWVLDTNTNIDIEKQESVFKMAGFDGCIGSSDGTHIPMLNCAQWASNVHKGFKLNVPARTYNVTVDHSRRIIGSTTGHPGTWNDKTLILFDDFICNVHKGKLYNDYEFQLYEKDINGTVHQVVYKGVWFMVDNGYLSWPCTVPPGNDGTTYELIRFSEWLESMRKDVECTFGIMKGRFCLLRYGLRFQSIVKCDQLWLTCCALHNMLLHTDGLDANWDRGVKSDWEISHMKDTRKISPYDISRLNRHCSINSESKSGANENLKTHISNQCRKYTVDNKRIVSKMPLDLFRRCLVNHFDIRFKRNDLIWPSRCNI